jgi:hypothetical protein
MNSELETYFGRVLNTLVQGKVDFIVIGGLAAAAHGSAAATFDVDVVYLRNRENIARLVSTLAPYGPYLRGAPPGLPFKWDERTVKMGLNFTLTTTLGNIDLLGEAAGGGDYNALLPHTVVSDMYGVRCRCVDLERLISMKRAAGRTKDLVAVAELEALLEEQRKKGHAK